MIFAFVILLLLLLPLIRLLFKRIILLESIRKICKRQNFNIKPTYFLWVFGSNSVSKCNFFIETKNVIFSVKIFGVLKHKSILIINSNRTYSLRKRRPIALTSFANVDSNPKFIPEYNFRFNYSPEWEIKSRRDILLINPVCKEVIYKNRNNKEILIGSGDVINGMYIYSLSRFLGVLESINDTQNI